MTATEPEAAPSRRAAALDALVADLRVVLPSWLAVRALTALGFMVAVAVIGHWAPGGVTLQSELRLVAWDAAFYRDIADFGYGGTRGEAVRFFPLFPGLGRLLGPVFLGRVDIALVVVANLASLAAAVVLRRLVLFEKGDEVLAERAVWAMALFPAAFVLSWAYAEGLFLVLAIGTVFAARRGRWELAALCGLLAALTRPLGVVLGAAVAIEVLRIWREAPARERARGVLATVAPALGLGAFLLWVGREFGDPMLPFSIQSEGFRETVDPVTRLLRGLGDLVGPERFGDGLHVPFFLAFIGLAVVVGRRWPASYTVFAVIVLIAAVSSENLNSLERYGLNAFPFALAIAEVTHTRRREWWGLALCGNGIVALAALAWMAIYVP